MSLRIRRGTNSQRTGITFDLGEIVYTTDTQKLYIGDGVTAGGKNLLETSVGNGFLFNPTTQQIDFAIGNLYLNTAQVPETSNLYFTTERAQDAVGAALVAGNAFNTGVTFTYDDANNRITAVSTGSAGLTTVSSDTNPSLGGNLNTGAFNISGSGSVTAGTITATNLGGNLNTGAFNISGSGTVTAGTVTAGTVTATNLGGNLNTGAFNISGTGSVTAGTVTAGTVTATNLGGNLNTGAFNISGTGSVTAGTITATNLGGNLSTGAFNISGTGTISAGTVTATNLGGNLSAATYNITNIGSLGATTITATNLGGNLNTGAFNISGTGTISAGTITATTFATNLGGSLLTGSINGGTGGIALFATNSIPLTITGNITGGATGQLYVNVRAARGTNSSPITTVAGDNLGGFVISGYNGSAFQGSAIISTAWEAGAVLSDTIPKSTLTLGVGGGGSTITRATLASNGVFTAPIFKATNYATSSYPTSPEKGWIIFDNTTNQFVGYNGTSWVAFA